MYLKFKHFWTTMRGIPKTAVLTNVKNICEKALSDFSWNFFKDELLHCKDFDRFAC